jgi:hypothetical protein
MASYIIGGKLENWTFLIMTSGTKKIHFYLINSKCTFENFCV